MKRIFPALLISLLAAGLIVTFAHAEGISLLANYCFPTYQADRCLGLGDSLGALAADLGVSAQTGLLRILCQVTWLLDRGAAFIFNRSVIDNTWILNVRNQMLQQFAALMPGLLREVVLGSSGLMYVAVALAGVLMTMPMIAAGERLVKIDRVLSWGVILIALFISGSFGYDLIGAIENFRQGMVTRIVTGAHLPTDKLILQPMRAGSGDLGFNDGDLMRLPPSFESQYFPEAELMEISIQATESGVTFGNLWIETEQSRTRRGTVSMTGVFHAVVSMFGAYLMFIFSVTYVLLTFAALVLIVFLFAALPLGFFEFGSLFLFNILGKYIQLVAFSLALAIFSRWFSSGLGFITDVNTVETSFLWLIILIVLIIIMHVFLDGAVKLLTQSAQSFGSNLTNLYGGGGTSVVKKTIGGVGGMIATGVGAAALLAGRPEVAMAASAARGGGGNPSPRPPMPRGDVFTNNGQQEQRPSQPVPVTPQQPSQQTPAGNTAPSNAQIAMPANRTVNPSAPAPLESEVQLRTLAAQEGWREAQIQLVRDEAARTPDVDGAVANLQRVPDFEKVNAENLRKAVRAAISRG